MLGPPLGYLFAVLIGITLGLLGGGGSILTVPTLVYVMNVDPKSAIAMSLPMVGLTSLLAGARHWRAGNVDLRVALGFGIVAMIGSLVAARSARLVPGIVQLTLLGVVMLGAAVVMIRRREATDSEPKARRPLAILVVGLGVGALTGLVGIGGGFMFVPALVILGGLPMKRAVGTSLIVIALNTAGGIAGYQGQAMFNWSLVVAFTGLMMVGSVVGERMAGRVPGETLRKWFAWFLVGMAGFILWENRAVILDPRGSLRPASVQVK